MTPTSYTFFAPASRGIAPLLAQELRDLGAESLEEHRAGVGFSGPLATGYRACLWSRLASRLLLVLARVDATTADTLYEGIRSLPWRDHMAPSGTLAVSFNGTSEAIRNSHFGALRVKDAVVDYFRDRCGERPSVDLERPSLRINIHLYPGQAVVSLDLSGQPLHRRGYRVETVEAPLKENLAAAILVTKESHCLEALVRDMKAGRIQATPKVILSNRPELASLARKLKLPFHHSPSDKKKDHEAFLIQQIQKVEADVIILARYMQILSPEFCFRYEDRIINIHPSLLPSFPGALPYAQAFNKGVEVAGVTAHFATTDLDQGPIITQEAFKVDKRKASLEEVKQKGRDKEAKVLCRAVKLFCSDELVLRRGKVVHSKKEHEIEAKTKEWF